MMTCISHKPNADNMKWSHLLTLNIWMKYSSKLDAYLQWYKSTVKAADMVMCQEVL